MKKFLITNLWWIVLIVAILLLVAHTASYEPVKVDHISLILLVVILLSPFILAIKKIKIGDFEAEIDPSEVQKIKEEVTKATDKTVQLPEIESTVNQIKELVKSDAVLALAKLRMELEKNLNHIYRSTHKGEQHRYFLPIGKTSHTLASKELIPKDIAKTIQEVVSICNRAMHGEDIRQKDAESVIESGSFLLYELTSYLDYYKFKPSETQIITTDIADEFKNAQYRLVTVTPLSKAPKKNIYILNQEELDEFIEGYNEYAEFIIEIVKTNEDN